MVVDTPKQNWLQQNMLFQVPFIEALELVRQRKVYLSGGYAFVPDTDLVTLVTASFRTNLSHALAVSGHFCLLLGKPFFDCTVCFFLMKC